MLIGDPTGDVFGEAKGEVRGEGEGDVRGDPLGELKGEWCFIPGNLKAEWFAGFLSGSGGGPSPPSADGVLGGERGDNKLGFCAAIADAFSPNLALERTNDVGSWKETK